MKLYNHQEAAISAAVEYLIEDDNDKGIISMCPRSGKSLVAQQIMIKLYEHYRTSVEPLFFYFVPTINLIEQIIHDFHNYFNNFENEYNPEIIGISSRSNIYIDSKKFEIYSGPTAISQIGKWYNNNLRKFKIVISTYDSSDKIIEFITKNMKNKDPIAFICDEAHILTSANQEIGNEIKVEEHKYLRIVNPIAISPIKQIFFTGTITKVLFANKSIDDATVQTDYTMDNRGLYGHTIYEFTYNKAITNNIVCKFDEISPKIKDIDKYSRDIEEFKDKMTTRDYNIFLYKFIIDIFLTPEHDVHHLLIYVNDSIEAYNLKMVIDTELNKDNINDIDVFAIYTGIVNDRSSPTPRERKEYIDKFKKSRKAILINIDIISIGITIKEIDSILFTKELNTETLIIQRIFRALTKDNNRPNKIGKILLPCATIESTKNTIIPKFKKINEILDRLKNDNDNWCERYISNKSYNSADSKSDKKNLEKEEEQLIKSEFIKQFYDENFMLKIKKGSSQYIYSLNRLRDILKSLNIKNIDDYHTKFIDTKKCTDCEILINPDKWYKNQWICWDDLFGGVDHYNYSDVKKIVHRIVHDKQIKTKEEYQQYYNDANRMMQTNRKEFDRIVTIPKNPSKFYIGKKDHWLSWSDFLGIEVKECDKDRTDRLFVKTTENAFVNPNMLKLYKIINEGNKIINVTNEYPDIFNDKVKQLMIKVDEKYNKKWNEHYVSNCDIELKPNKTIKRLMINLTSKSCPKMLKTGFILDAPDGYVTVNEKSIKPDREFNNKYNGLLRNIYTEVNKIYNNINYHS